MTARRFGYPRGGPGPRPDGAQTRPAGTPNETPHFWDAGPGAARPLTRPYTYRGVRYTHEVRWYLDRVEEASRWRALTAIWRVLRDPRGWRRAGLRFARTYRRADADILLRVLPQDTTVCGPGAAGCWSWSGVPGEVSIAEVGVEYLGDPVAFATILGMELVGHGAVHALDMYNPRHQPYRGSLGTWEEARAVGGMPTDAEVAAVRAWLAGRADPATIHED